MGGGLMQLVAYGAQDVYLTGNPQITFFKVAYRRHTNFSIETVDHSFSNADFGRRPVVTITRNGDLITKMYLSVTLPNVSAPSGANDETKFAWCRRLGYSMIDSVELEIGGSRIDKQYGQWMNSWYDLSCSNEHDRGHAEMIGDTADLTELTSADGEGYCKRSKVLYVPLYFWFCRNNGLALPLIALQYHEVRVHFELRAASELCCYTGAFLTSPPSPSLLDASLLVDYIYLDSEERRRFAQVGHEYLIEQVQFTGEEGVQATTAKPKLSFNHPTKELVWMAQHGSFTSGKKFLVYTGSNDWADAVQEAADNLALGMLKLNSSAAVPTVVAATTSSGAVGGDGFANPEGDSYAGAVVVATTGGSIIPGVRNDNVLYDGTTDLSDKISRIEVVLDDDNVVVSINAVHTITLRDVSRALDQWTTDNRNAWVKAHRDVVVYQHHNTGLLLDGTKNPVQKALLQLNGHDRFDQQNGAYFNYVQPHQYHSRTPPDGVNVYSFALDPEKHQPSGSANLSRIDTTQLNLWFADSSSTGSSSDDGFSWDFVSNTETKLFIYALSYNVLRIMSGMGGLAYSN